jgi:hypothetical protein
MQPYTALPSATMRQIKVAKNAATAAIAAYFGVLSMACPLRAPGLAAPGVQPRA